MEKLLIILMLALVMATPLSQGAPSSIAQDGRATVSRGECIKQVAEFMASIKLGSEVEQQLSSTRTYYRVSRNYYENPEYRSTKYSDGCRLLHARVVDIKTRVPCYYNDTIMGVNEVKNVKDVCAISEGARLVLEGEYSCFYKYASGAAMNANGLFEAITGEPYTEF